MLADEVLGARRETVSSGASSPYRDASAEIEADPNQFIYVVEDADSIVGIDQIAYLNPSFKSLANLAGAYSACEHNVARVVS